MLILPQALALPHVLGMLLALFLVLALPQMPRSSLSVSVPLCRSLVGAALSLLQTPALLHLLEMLPVMLKSPPLSVPLGCTMSVLA